MNYHEREKLRDATLKTAILKRVPEGERGALLKTLNDAFAEVDRKKLDAMLAIPFPSDKDRAKIAKGMLRDVVPNSAPRARRTHNLGA